jgi:hypothetical protein
VSEDFKTQVLKTKRKRERERVRDEEREGGFLGVGNSKLGLGGGWIRLCCRGQAYQGAQTLNPKSRNRSPNSSGSSPFTYFAIQIAEFFSERT